MTGQLISRNGVYDNAAEFRADRPTFCHYLRQLGYQTYLSGKMHFCGPDQLHGFDQRLTTDIYPADFGWTPDWRAPERRLDWYHNMSSVLDAGECIRTNQLDFDDEAVFHARQKLFDLARRDDDQPFLLLMSLTHPHDPFAIPRRYLDRYAPEDIDLPRVAASDAPPDAHSERLRRMYQLTDGLLDPQQIRRARHAYYGALAYVDDQFGAVRETLEATGLADNTILMLISDHGEMLGERGLWYKMNFFEGAARVPMIIHAPARFPPHRVEHNVSLVDLLPTLVELAAGHPPEPTALGAPLDGHSLVPHLTGQTGPDGVYAEYLAEGALAPMLMIRRGQWKFIASAGEPAQLYDLHNDPLELTNLADATAYEAQLRQFQQEADQRWNINALERQVLDSQRARLFLNQALGPGGQPEWDFQPRQDASHRFIRNNQTLDEQEAQARYPRPPSTR